MILDPKKLIIKRSDLATPQQRLTTLGLLIFFCMIVLYLVHKFTAVLGWGVAALLHTRATVEASGVNALLDMALAYFPVIATLCCAFACWAWYNKLRFSGERDKRQLGEFFLDNTQIASSFKLAEETIEDLQQAHLIFINYDKNGCIAELEFS